MTIIQTAENQWTTNNGRGTDLTLVKQSYGWHVLSMNASARAWRGNMGGCRTFNSLAEIEQHYKCLRGLSILLGEAAAC